jgi:hypothetical protein
MGQFGNVNYEEINTKFETKDGPNEVNSLLQQNHIMFDYEGNSSCDDLFTTSGVVVRIGDSYLSGIDTLKGVNPRTMGFEMQTFDHHREGVDPFWVSGKTEVWVMGEKDLKSIRYPLDTEEECRGKEPVPAVYTKEGSSAFVGNIFDNPVDALEDAKIIAYQQSHTITLEETKQLEGMRPKSEIKNLVEFKNNNADSIVWQAVMIGSSPSNVAAQFVKMGIESRGFHNFEPNEKEVNSEGHTSLSETVKEIRKNLGPAGTPKDVVTLTAIAHNFREDGESKLTAMKKEDRANLFAKLEGFAKVGLENSGPTASWAMTSLYKNVSESNAMVSVLDVKKSKESVVSR